MKITTLLIFTVILTLTVSAEDPSNELPSTPFRADKAGKAGAHLFILSGQSNMAGLKSDRLFNPIVEKAFGKENVIVVRKAWSGQPIRKWYNMTVTKKTPKGPMKLYKNMMDTVKEAVKDRKLASVTFIWMQGETDAVEKKSDVYEACLRGLVAEVKKDMGVDTLNVVIGRICDWQKKVNDPHWKKLRDVQVKVAESDPNGAWVNTDDLNDDKMRKGKLMVNPLHYSSKGYETLGKRFAEKAIELVNEKGKSK